MTLAFGKLSFNRAILDPFEEFVFVPQFMRETKNGSSSCVALETSRINDRRLFNYSTSDITSIYTKTTVNYSSALYTLKDGYPRLNLIPTTTITITYTTVHKILQNYPTPHPDCDIRTELSCRKCTVHGGMDVQLIYWGNTNKTKLSTSSAALTDSSPVTAVFNGTTFTSPSVYLSYGKIGVYDGCGVDFLHTYTNVLVTLPPSALSSLEQDDSENIVTRSFNLGDLTDPIPASAYLHQITCAIVNNTNDCLPIPPLSRYSPVVAVPQEIFSIDPYFKSCDLYFRGAWDPPRILVPAQALGPTSAVGAKLPIQKIQPGASPKPFEPDVTAEPQLTPSPSPKSNGAPNGDISGNSFSANKNPNANRPTLNNYADNHDVPTANLLPTTLDQASRTVPVVVEAYSSFSGQIHDPNRAGIVTDHIPSTLFPSTNATPTPVPILPPTTLDHQSVEFDGALSRSLSWGNDLNLLTTPIPLATAIVIGSNTLTFLPALKTEEPSTILPTFTFDGRLSSASGNNHILLISSPPKLLPTLTIGDITITPNPASQYNINGQTLFPGGPAITVSSTSISLAQDASALYVGTNPIFLATPPPIPPPTPTIGDLAITPNAKSQYIIDSQTLIPGGPAITLSSTRLSLAPDASALIIGTNTISFIPYSHKSLPTLTIGDLTIIPNAASQYNVNGQTLIPGGPAITLASTRIFLDPSASVLVVGTKTSNLFSITTNIIPNSQQGEDLGILILKGLGIQYTSSRSISATTTVTMDPSRDPGFVANTTASGPAEVFRGDASRQSRISLLRTMIMLVGVSVLMRMNI